MALYVNTNVSSLNAQRKLTNSTNALNVSYQRLASGLRINSAKDDAAGLLISNRLTSQINGLDQGNRNANDAIALAQTIEGALDETANMLQRIRTLAVQAANGTYTDEDRAAMQQEVTQLSQEITRISEKTTYGGARVLDGAEAGGDSDPTTNGNLLNTVNPINLLGFSGQLTFQVGSNHDDTLTLSLSTGFSMSAIANHWKFDDSIDLDNYNAGSGTFTPSGSYFDIPYSSITKATGLSGSSIDFTNDEDANGETNTGLVREVVTDGSWDTGTGFTGSGTAPVSFVRWSVSSANSAQATLANIDKFIQYVDSKRADLGAMQNRMESTIRNQSSISENESDARSRIRDTDFASETAALTQNNIIQQASQSILAQANQRPTIALSLLGQ